MVAKIATPLKEHISEEHIVNIFVNQHGDPLPMVECFCSEPNTRQLANFHNQYFDSLMFSPVQFYVQILLRSELEYGVHW